jgi:hypothetical protein
VFLPNRDNFPSRPYNEDGNPEMYTTENIEKREALRTNETVGEAIRLFIKTTFKLNAQGNYTKDEYMRVFINVGTILRPLIDAEELQKIVKDDFDQDSMDKENNDKDEGGMPKVYDYLDMDKLYNALFELADSWCPNIDEFEYKEFFDQLTFNLKYAGQKDTSAYDVL